MPGTRPKSLVVAVVGATGAVGRTMTQVLLEHDFPMRELRLLASERSAGKTMTVGGDPYVVGLATPDAFEGVDIALFSAGGGTSTVLAPAAAPGARP
jgi:aspartate-semialdehyde dehydrogenase